MLGNARPRLLRKSGARKSVVAVTVEAVRPTQCPLCPDSDQISAAQRNDAMCQLLTCGRRLLGGFDAGCKRRAQHSEERPIAVARTPASCKSSQVALDHSERSFLPSGQDQTEFQRADVEDAGRRRWR